MRSDVRDLHREVDRLWFWLMVSYSAFGVITLAAAFISIEILDSGDLTPWMLIGLPAWAPWVRQCWIVRKAIRGVKARNDRLDAPTSTAAS